jgi:peptide/nickel transport system substrate-binding protein
MIVGRLVLAAVLVAAAWTAASADDPLYLQPPYDEIVLDESNGRAVLRVAPLPLPNRRVPAVGERSGDLEFELVDRPGEKFAVPWVNVDDIRTFERLVLAEADGLAKEGRFDDAQPIYSFLESRDAKLPGLAESIETFLYMQVGGAYRAQRFEESMALLVELYARNPARQGVSTAYERVTGELVKGHLAAGRYAAARGLLKNLGLRYPATQATTVATYEGQLAGQAAELFAKATAAKDAGKLREAHEAVHQALAMWPDQTGAGDLARAIHQQYPVVKVGVVAPLAGPPHHRIDDWAAFRTSRLLKVPLIVADGRGAEYHSALGEIAIGEDRRQVSITRTGDTSLADTSRPFAPELVRQVFAAADSKDEQFDAVWVDVFAGASVQGGRLLVDFVRPQPLPQAWLAAPLGPGPFMRDSAAGDLTRYVRQAGSLHGATPKLAEIVERTFPDSSSALAALHKGEIGLIDRLSPWDVPAAAAIGGVSVRRYKAPTVHVLVPNPARPLLASRTMRRALLYGIDREGILRRGLVGGQQLAGCEVLSGPLPRGAAGERFAEGNDASVEPRPYEPGTGLILANLAANEALGPDRATGPLVLAHPANPVARTACQSIARQLKLLNLQVALKESKTGQLPRLADCDLLYAELLIQEPTVDVWRVLGPHGLAGSCSPAMLQALRQVEAAAGRKEAGEKLKAVHRLAAVELPVIPLWQLAEHFTVHATVQGVAERPASLYEGVENWQAELRVIQ